MQDRCRRLQGLNSGAKPAPFPRDILRSCPAVGIAVGCDWKRGLPRMGSRRPCRPKLRTRSGRRWKCPKISGGLQPHDENGCGEKTQPYQEGIHDSYIDKRLYFSQPRSPRRLSRPAKQNILRREPGSRLEVPTWFARQGGAGRQSK
jgi:hypothetical protein